LISLFPFLSRVKSSDPNDYALQVFIPKALLRSTVGWQMTRHSCSRPDEVDCTVNETLAVFVLTFLPVFTFYFMHQLSISIYCELN